MLIIIGLMLAVPLAQDMDQAAHEEAALDFHTRRLSEAGKAMRPAHALLRTSLRVRRFALPVTTACAGAPVGRSRACQRCRVCSHGAPVVAVARRHRPAVSALAMGAFQRAT